MSNKKRMSVKDKIAVGTAVAAFILGWGMTLAGFIVEPLGEIANSVLWVLGQALIYAASVFGISGYFTASAKKMKDEIREYVRTGDERALED